MRKIEIYTRGWCGYCHMAKALLQSLGCTYEEYDVDHDGARRQEMYDRTGGRTVPQVVIDGHGVGGFTEIARLHAAGLLVPMLNGDAPTTSAGNR